MKVITIGRERGNNIVINDDYVGRKHLKLTCDDQGNVILKDLGSINGTYVNERKIKGEVYLNENDTVQIGKTTIPWQSYFPASTRNKEKKKRKLVGEKEPRKPFPWRGILTAITTIVSLLATILMLFRLLA